MFVQDMSYLTTEEAARYLKLKERKLYDLAASGAVPASKVTGKWLFPRAALDRWIEAGLARPDGFTSAEPPPVIGGSHDLLLDWAMRRSGAGLALLPEGSEAGLHRLMRNEVMAAALHFHDETLSETANVTAVLEATDLEDGVLIALARREQGLLMLSENTGAFGSLAEAVAGKARFGLRQRGAGAQMLLDGLLARAGLNAEALVAGPGSYPTGQDLALAIRSGEVDCGIGARSVAVINGLGFLPLYVERLDLAMRRRSYFMPAMQGLMTTLRAPGFVRQAEAFGGYDVSETGQIRANR